MERKKIFRAFLSYAHADKKADAYMFEMMTTQLETELNACLHTGRFDIWRDQTGLFTGDLWEEKIELTLRECDIFIALLSPRWIGSKNCRREFAIFNKLKGGLVANDPNCTQTCIMPVLCREIKINDVKLSVEERRTFNDVTRTQYFSAIYEEDRETLVKRLAADIMKVVYRIQAMTSENYSTGRANFPIKNASGKAPKASALNVGFFHYPPFSTWTDLKTGSDLIEPVGPWVELSKNLLRAKGLNYKAVRFSASDFSKPENPRPEVVLGVFKTGYRTNFYNFSEPLYRIGLNGVVRASAKKVTLKQMSAGLLRIVVQEGEVGWEYAGSKFLKAIENQRLTTVHTRTTADVIDMMLAGRYDIAFTDEVSCCNFLSDMKYISRREEFALAFKRPLEIFDVCLAFDPAIGWDAVETNNQLKSLRN